MPTGNIFIAMWRVWNRIEPKWGIWMVGYIRTHSGFLYASHNFISPVAFARPSFSMSLYQMTSNKSIWTDADKTGIRFMCDPTAIDRRHLLFQHFRKRSLCPSLGQFQCVNNSIQWSEVNWAFAKAIVANWWWYASVKTTKTHWKIIYTHTHTWSTWCRKGWRCK